MWVGSGLGRPAPARGHSLRDGSRRLGSRQRAELEPRRITVVSAGRPNPDLADWRLQGGLPAPRTGSSASGRNFGTDTCDQGQPRLGARACEEDSESKCSETPASYERGRAAEPPLDEASKTGSAQPDQHQRPGELENSDQAHEVRGATRRCSQDEQSSEPETEGKRRRQPGKNTPTSEEVDEFPRARNAKQTDSCDSKARKRDHERHVSILAVRRTTARGSPAACSCRRRVSPGGHHRDKHEAAAPKKHSPDVALTELVANCWDTGTSRIDIIVPSQLDGELSLSDETACSDNATRPGAGRPAEATVMNRCTKIARLRDGNGERRRTASRHEPERAAPPPALPRSPREPSLSAGRKTQPPAAALTKATTSPSVTGVFRPRR